MPETRIQQRAFTGMCEVWRLREKQGCCGVRDSVILAAHTIPPGTGQDVDNKISHPTPPPPRRIKCTATLCQYRASPNQMNAPVLGSMVTEYSVVLGSCFFIIHLTGYSLLMVAKQDMTSSPG